MAHGSQLGCLGVNGVTPPLTATKGEPSPCLFFLFYLSPYPVFFFFSHTWFRVFLSVSDFQQGHEQEKDVRRGLLYNFWGLSRKLLLIWWSNVEQTSKEWQTFSIHLRFCMLLVH